MWFYHYKEHQKLELRVDHCQVSVIFYLPYTSINIYLRLSLLQHTFWNWDKLRGLSFIGVGFAAVRNENLRRIVEEPGEKVSWCIEESGKEGDEGEIGDASADVTASEKNEPGEGEGGLGIFWCGAVPVETGEDVYGEGDSIEAGDEKQEWNDRGDEVEDDEEDGETDEDGDLTVAAVGRKAKEVDDLGGEKEDEADFGSVVEGENNVGDTGGEHGGEKEIIFRESFSDVEKTEGDAADTKKRKKVVTGGGEAEDSVDEEERNPESKPEGWDMIIEF